MEKIFIQEIGRIKKGRAQVEKVMNVKLVFTPDGIEISGEDGLSEYLARKVVEALDNGFQATAALQLKNEDYMFERLNIKDYTRSSRLQTIKGRLIGTKGRAKDVISELTDCDIAIKDYSVGIIGKTSDVDVAVSAIKDIIGGLPHAKIFAYLEKSRKIRLEKIEEQEDFSRGKEPNKKLGKEDVDETQESEKFDEDDSLY